MGDQPQQSRLLSNQQISQLTLMMITTTTRMEICNEGRHDAAHKYRTAIDFLLKLVFSAIVVVVLAGFTGGLLLIHAASRGYGSYLASIWALKRLSF